MDALHRNQLPSITLPNLTLHAVTTAYAQIRPYREGGNKLAMEKIAHTIFFHNYGHGGAGVSLAPGSAEAILDIYDQ